MSQTAIADAIAAAKTAAAAAPAAANAALAGEGGVPALAPTGGALGAPAQRGAPLMIDDLLSGSLNVAGWLKVNEYGLIFGTDKKFHDTVEVVLNMNEISYCYSIRYGNPAVYEKTYDRVTNVKGGSWIDTVARAQRVDPKASEFRSADIPFYLVADVIGKDGNVVFSAGQAVGHSLSITGWKSFQNFIRELQGKGIDIYNGKVMLTLGWDEQSNAKGTWGILKFSDPKAVQ